MTWLELLGLKRSERVTRGFIESKKWRVSTFLHLSEKKAFSGNQQVLKINFYRQVSGDKISNEVKVFAGVAEIQNHD